MMVLTPKVSIIIRTLNEAAFLPSLLDLINNQSYKNFEIIIVDSGSKDDTQKIAKEFSDKLLFRITLKDADATSEAKGFPPKVDPCVPGVIQFITLSLAKTAEIGKTPPDKAFPKHKISGLISS